MSFAPQVKVIGEDKFVGNALRFATEQEAHDSAYDLSARWTAVIDFHVAPSDDPVNYSYIGGVLTRVLS